MREILFRGKRIDNGEWIEGSLINDDGRCFIAIHPSLAFGTTSKDEINGETLWGFYPFFEVDPKSVSEFTGLTDKNGKKIFEGDIVRETITSYYQPIGKIYYDTKNCQLRIEYVNNIASVGHIGDGRIYELLGNIYDTPMLLEDKP